MGFDVLYLPPIHPDRARRSARAGTTPSPRQPDDVGSPWAIGAREGGHKAIHPELGTLADFRHLVMAARARGIEIALDIAFQCAPGPPVGRRSIPSGSASAPTARIQYAENPPKKYQDIYPFDFETADWRALWHELRDVFAVLGRARACAIFRVDNPHTKPFAFWEWVIARGEAASIPT